MLITRLQKTQQQAYKTPFNKTRYNKPTQQTASSCGPVARWYEPGACAVLQHDGTSPALLTDCNPFVFILCKIIYVLLRLNVHNIHVIHMIEVEGSKKQAKTVPTDRIRRFFRVD